MTPAQVLQKHQERWLTTGQSWMLNHRHAWRMPSSGFESSIVGSIRAWIVYAEAHQALYDSSIADDGVLGIHWANWGSAIIGLLNGETGRLDCGPLDSLIRDVAATAGHTEEM